MKKNPIYIPGQDKWSEHFPTPGKLSPGNFGHLFCNPSSDFNNLLRIIEILSRALLPTKDPRRRENLLHPKHKISLITTVPHIPITI